MMSRVINIVVKDRKAKKIKSEIKPGKPLMVVTNVIAIETSQ